MSTAEQPTNASESSNTDKKPVILSGMQPSQSLTIGNYLGALKNWVELQDTHDCYFAVVDLHSITTRVKPADLRKWTLDVAALYVAAGIDPEKCSVFIQSQVPYHSQLAWVLNCYTQFGECNKMTQFKDKSQQHADNINVGLFTYPVLMAADILLYQTDVVPVGDDQKQHLELTRNVAERFNHYYPNTFTVPEPYIMKVGARVASLQDPTRKMSKSDPNAKATLYLLDTPTEIQSKIRKAVTDSGTEIRFDKEERPAISNLLTLFHAATGEDITVLEERFAGKGYAEFKQAVADAVVSMLEPMHTRFNELRSDKAELQSILEKGAEKANHRAFKTLRKVYKKVGFVQF
jgi:tryptophanyl-tRNA synthetase